MAANIIMVTGCGFCGTNAIISYLRDKFNYFVGERFVKPNKQQHPYPVWEDLDIFNIQEAQLTQLTKINLLRELFIIQCKFPRAFKTPNLMAYHCLYLLAFPNMKIIAGMRDTETLISRMKERWNYTEQQAKERIKKYHEEIDILQPLIIDQQELLHNPETQLKRMENFISD